MRKSNLILFGIMLCNCLSAIPRARTVYMKDSDMEPVHVVLGRSTILSFPSKPNKVILGNKNQYAIEYIENDIALAALQTSSRGNLFVYLEGRRFAFDLSTVSAGGDEILMVRDESELQVKRWKLKRK